MSADRVEEAVAELQRELDGPEPFADLTSRGGSQIAERVRAVLSELERLRHDHDLLRRVINEDMPGDEACTDKCDRYGHGENCKNGDAAQTLINLKAKLDALRSSTSVFTEAHLKALRLVHVSRPEVQAGLTDLATCIEQHIRREPEEPSSLFEVMQEFRNRGDTNG